MKNMYRNDSFFSITNLKLVKFTGFKCMLTHKENKEIEIFWKWLGPLTLHSEVRMSNTDRAMPYESKPDPCRVLELHG